MKMIDYEKWERKEVYEFFSGLSDPFYMVSFKIDVTVLHEYAKEHGLSFYKALIWACDEAINGVEAFMVSFNDGGLVMLERRDPSFTDLKKGSELFHIVTMEHHEDIRTFCKEADLISNEQDTFIDLSKETDGLIYYSCLPWLELSAMSNEKDLSSEKSRNDSIPRISWGRFVEEKGRRKLTICMEVNHRFIDGIHIGMFAERLEKIIVGLEEKAI